MAPQRTIARSVLMGVVGVTNCVIYKGGGGTGTSMTEPYGDGWISMGNISAGTPMTGPYGDGWISMGNTSAAAAAPNNAGDTMLLQLANWSAGKDSTGEESTDEGPFNVKTMVKHLFTAGNHLLVPMEVQTNRRMQRILRHVLAEVREDMGLQRRKRECCMCPDGKGGYYQKLEGNSKRCAKITGKFGGTCTPCDAEEDGGARSSENILKKYKLVKEQAAKKKEEYDRKERERLEEIEREKERLEEEKHKLWLGKLKKGVKEGLDKHYMREQINEKLRALKEKEDRLKEEEEDRLKEKEDRLKALKEEEDQERERKHLEELEEKKRRLKDHEKHLEDRKSKLLLHINARGKKGVDDEHQEHLKDEREEINKKLQDVKREEAEVKVQIVEEEKDIVEDENEALKKKVKVLEANEAKGALCMKPTMPTTMRQLEADPLIEEAFKEFDARVQGTTYKFNEARLMLINSALDAHKGQVNQWCTRAFKRDHSTDEEVKALVEYWQCRTCIGAPTDSRTKKKNCNKGDLTKLFNECEPK